MDTRNFYSPFAARLRELLEERNMTIYALSKEINISRQAVSKYFNGETTPNAEKLAAICNYLNVSADWLLGIPGGVKTINPSEAAASKYTGLSSEAMQTLLHYKDEGDPLNYFMLDRLLATDAIADIFNAVMYDFKRLTADMYIEDRFSDERRQIPPSERRIYAEAAASRFMIEALKKMRKTYTHDLWNLYE